MGRPKLSEDKKQKYVSVRIDQATYDKITALCQKTNLPRVEVIRMAFEKLDIAVGVKGQKQF